ncbi:hypothetical protein ACFLS0_04755 [Candidatus Bipolaricaulota bacterium]
MKTHLIIAVLVVGLGIPAGAQSLSGFIDHSTTLYFDNGGLDEFGFGTKIGIEYGIADWAFGTFLDLEDDYNHWFGYPYEWDVLAFSAVGSLGATEVYSLLQFESFGDTLSASDMWQDWDTVLRTKIAGVEMWAILSLLARTEAEELFSGAGSAFGLHGQAGALEVWTEVQFNLYSVVDWIFANWFDEVLRKNQAYYLIEVLDWTSCAMDFSFADVYATFPFLCTDVRAWIGFDDDGFYAFELWVEDLETGIDWLQIDYVDLQYETDGKYLMMELEVSLDAATCIKPYVSLVQDNPFSVSGIRIEALELSYQIGDATIVFSELMYRGELYLPNYYLGIDARIHPWPSWWWEWWDPTSYFMIPSQCTDPMFAAEEAIGLEIGGTGCCAPFLLGIYSFFDIDLTDVLFDWMGLRVLFKDGLTSKLSWSIESWLMHDGLEWIEFGFSYSWGDVRSISSDETCLFLYD